MTSLRYKLRSLSWFYRGYRSVIMAFKRYRYGLDHVHPTFFMTGHSSVSSDLVAHEYSHISQECLIGPQVELGAYVMIGPRVAIVGADHIIDCPGVPMRFSGRPPMKRTIVETDVWVGYGAIIMAGVRLGRGSIVAAGAVVTKDVPPYHIYGGVPAKKIGERFIDPEEREIHDLMLASPPQEGSSNPPLQQYSQPVNR